MLMEISDTLELLARGGHPDPGQAEAMFDALLSRELTEIQGAAFLMGLRAKGETAGDLAAGVRAALRHARAVPGIDGPRIDTCGTGGDGTCSFNCSTAVGLYLADMGHQVVKHGNRAVSSSCGSADALEALGVPLDVPPEKGAEELAKNNFLFLFAPAYHPSFAAVAPIRKEMGIRTIFNFMGPLLNPARPTHQLLGVGVPSAMKLMASSLAETGLQRALVVHGAGGFDELTTFGPSQGYLVEKGTVESYEIDPQALGFKPHEPADVAVGKDRNHAVAVLRQVLAGTGPEAMLDMVAINLGACLYLLEGGSMAACMEQAREKTREGIRQETVNAG